MIVSLCLQLVIAQIKQWLTVDTINKPIVSIFYQTFNEAGYMNMINGYFVDQAQFRFEKKVKTNVKAWAAGNKHN